jgi:hypothetical protein
MPPFEYYMERGMSQADAKRRVAEDVFDSSANAASSCRRSAGSLTSNRACSCFMPCRLRELSGASTHRYRGATVFQIRTWTLAAFLHPECAPGEINSGQRRAAMEAGMQAERARIETEARKLARSGEYSSWRSVERALLARTCLTQVPCVFANAWTRSELDRLCRQAQLYRKESA